MSRTPKHPWAEIRERYISSRERPNVSEMAREYGAAPTTFYRHMGECSDKGDDWEELRQETVRKASQKEAERRQREQARSTARVTLEHQRLLAVQRSLLTRKFRELVPREGEVDPPPLDPLVLDRVSKITGRTVHDERLVHGLTTEHAATSAGIPRLDDMTVDELLILEESLNEEDGPEDDDDGND